MKVAKKCLLLIGVLFIFTVPMVGCSTVHGMGQDMQDVNYSLTNALNPDD